MRKNFRRALVVLLCITLFAGCTPSPSEAGTPAHADATSDIANSTFHFDSYEDMISAFGKRDLNPSAYTIRELKKLLGEPYTRFVDRVNADRGFPQPMLDGEPIPYRNQEGFSNITFCVNELYGFPWVFYYPTVSTGENFYIHATYLPDEGSLLKFDVYTAEGVTLIVTVDVATSGNFEKYKCRIPVKAGGKWKRIVLNAIDFKNDLEGKNLKSFLYGKALSFESEREEDKFAITNIIWL